MNWLLKTATVQVWALLKEVISTWWKLLDFQFSLHRAREGKK
ncbi:hypothetical protein HMPREF3198_01621 [Winkia neuii]|nr:hypothetical protein HMPREF3198_01621 [Winkia neuii]